MSSMEHSQIPARAVGDGTVRGYVRFAAVGDSLTFGLGDQTGAGPRGWARILADAIGHDHDVSFANLARPGATLAEVRRDQVADAAAHRPHIASVIVGLNDTMRSSWNAVEFRTELLGVACELRHEGALLLTARFHDHSRVFRLPGTLARPLRRRIEMVNEAYDEVHERYGGLRVDLAGHPGVYDREFWSVDRLHPSELGHRALAHEFAELLQRHGLQFRPPALELDGLAPSRLHELDWLLRAGVPWCVRRAADLAPMAARDAVHRVRARRARAALRAA